MKIGLIPLDERPANTRYPKMLAEISGSEVALPPAEILSSYRTPARTDALLAWLAEQGEQCDALIASCETLGYGGLIYSRISTEPAAPVIDRLEALRALKARRPALRVLGFNLITRIPSYNDATEEPAYWGQYGADLFRLSQLLDRAERGEAVIPELTALREQLPPEHVADFLRRRLRNHTVNLAALQLAADGVFDLLVVSSDDTSPYGLGTREKRWVAEWASRLKLDDRLLMYPGADEVGSVLVARAISQQAGRAPSFQVEYAVPGGKEITAAFEDGPVQLTVERQIRAAGATITQENGDIFLLVNPPRSSEAGWPIPYGESELRERQPHLQAAVARLAQRVADGQLAAVADVAHSNGADAVFVEELRRRDLLLRLAAYSAWNTAGNSIGTTVAQAAIAWQGGRDSVAQRRFLAHRLIEDWAYMGVVREQANQWLYSQTDPRNPAAELIDAAPKWIEPRLAEAAKQLGAGFRIVPGSLCLPWKRTFEIDFDLETI